MRIPDQRLGVYNRTRNQNGKLCNSAVLEMHGSQAKPSMLCGKILRCAVSLTERKKPKELHREKKTNGFPNQGFCIFSKRDPGFLPFSK
jgi:hypothetical protein